jgi:hypothetical protein
MPATTPNMGLPYPLPADPIDTAGDIQRLADSIDVLARSLSRENFYARWEPTSDNAFTGTAPATVFSATATPPPWAEWAYVQVMATGVAAYQSAGGNPIAYMWVRAGGTQDGQFRVVHALNGVVVAIGWFDVFAAVPGTPLLVELVGHKYAADPSAGGVNFGVGSTVDLVITWSGVQNSVFLTDSAGGSVS